MGVAGLIFEPHSPNFENQYNCRRNDAKMIFLFIYWFQIFKDQCQNSDMGEGGIKNGQKKSDVFYGWPLITN